MNNTTLVVNFFGGPGTGKSTMAARIFASLKEQGFITELATEYAKDLVWQESNKVLLNQIYVFGKQHHRIWRLNGQVDIIVTDSPLLMGLVYGNTSDTYKALVVEEHKKLRTLNIFLTRGSSYETQGRIHSEEDAKKIDSSILEVLNKYQKHHFKLPAKTTSIAVIMQLIKARLVDAEV